jgi:hypothetical protein
MVWMRAVGVHLDVGRSAAHVGDGGIGEGVEEIILSKDTLLLFLLGRPGRREAFFEPNARGMPPR